MCRKTKLNQSYAIVLCHYFQKGHYEQRSEDRTWNSQYQSLTRCLLEHMPFCFESAFENKCRQKYRNDSVGVKFTYQDGGLSHKTQMTMVISKAKAGYYQQGIVWTLNKWTILHVLAC
jgi:hypothetical protein